MIKKSGYILSVLMLICLFHTGCSDMIADLEGNTVSAGGGDTIEIYTAEDLDAVRNNLSGNYILMADIDLSGYASGEGWVPIGDNSNHFTGTLYGNGHRIGNLTISRSGSSYQGLFGCIGSSGTVVNLGLAGGSVTGGNNTGFLAGENYGTVSDCFAMGSVNSSSYNVGGLVGFNRGTVSICYATGNVTGTGWRVGGLVGLNYRTVSGCFAMGSVNSSSEYVGGLVGYNYGTVSICFAMGNVATSSGLTGGLIGGNEGMASCCYATGNVNGIGSFVGGLTGYNSGSIRFCYYYQLPDNSLGTIVSSEADMRQQFTYTGWDFSTVWGIDASINSGYPYLRENMP
jgi:hypothetical protein